MTQPTNHRLSADDHLAAAEQASTSQEIIGHALLAIAHYLGALLAEELEGHPGLPPLREHDDDNPDSLAEWVDGDTVVRPLPYPWGAA